MIVGIFGDVLDGQMWVVWAVIISFIVQCRDEHTIGDVVFGIKLGIRTIFIMIVE